MGVACHLTNWHLNDCGAGRMSQVPADCRFRKGHVNHRWAGYLAEGDNTARVSLHPSASERYRAKVGQIHEALTKGDAASLEAITILRDLIDHIVVTPTERPAPVELRVVGNLAALLVENTTGTGVAVSMVAGARTGQYRQETWVFKTGA